MRTRFLLSASLLLSFSIAGTAAAGSSAPDAAPAADGQRHGLVSNGVKFQGTKFQGVKFQGTKFQGVKFQGTKFQGVKFQGTKFQGVKFQGIDLHGAEDRRLSAAGYASGTVRARLPAR